MYGARAAKQSDLHDVNASAERGGQLVRRAATCGVDGSSERLTYLHGRITWAGRKDQGVEGASHVSW